MHPNAGQGENGMIVKPGKYPNLTLPLEGTHDRRQQLDHEIAQEASRLALQRIRRRTG
jgi:hypothetical protein